MMNSEETGINKGITESTLKIAAMVFMVIDHIGGGIIKRYYQSVHIGYSYSDIKAYLDSSDPVVWYGIIYQLIRGIGRLAFPIFIFCLIEGFFHTRSRLKYAARLLLFAFISEVPYDFALKKGLFVKEYQNVYFTLLIGLLTVWAIEECVKRLRAYGNDALNVLVMIMITTAGAYIAQVIHTDYSATGVLAIVFTYLLSLRKDFDDPKYTAHFGDCAILTCSMPNEFPCFFSLFLIKNYNGKRGLNLKYAFYFIYPVHLLIIGIICKKMGI